MTTRQLPPGAIKDRIEKCKEYFLDGGCSLDQFLDAVFTFGRNQGAAACRTRARLAEQQCDREIAKRKHLQQALYNMTDNRNAALERCDRLREKCESVDDEIDRLLDQLRQERETNADLRAQLADALLR